MISRNLYFQIVIRVLAIVVIALVAGFIYAEKSSVGLTVTCLLVELPLVFNLISYLNTTNRRISYFLESVQNNDSTLLFPENITGKSIRELYDGLKKINEQIQRLKIENQQREQYFQTLLEHVATGIITFNSKGFVLHANSAVKKLLSVEVLSHVHQLERISRNLYQAVQNIKPFEQKLVSIVTERGTIELSLKSTSFKTQSEELILLSVQDIRNELDEKELDSWMKLIRVLMHEIMNSIAPITSLSESLSQLFTVEGRELLPEEVNEKTIRTTVRGLNVIGEQGNGLIKFVESYRKLTRLPKPDQKIFKAESLVSRVKVLYSSFDNSDKVKLFVTVHPPELEIFADENLISQVLLNLVKNALEAVQEKEDGQIRITVYSASSGRPEICVSDNGSGIPREILEQIFVPFFTTREKGSGIGLSLSRQIMRLHGGSLQVRSVADKETAFTLGF
ncbi:MAG: ATP-binding protein [Prolixibacteraceae bacterium]|jgi:nitrogen fixation/metabolism regulation signal transduction histidine kinase